MNFSDYLYYDETSPSCLRWKVQRGKYKQGDVAGAVSGREGNKYWEVSTPLGRAKIHRIIQSWFYGVPVEDITTIIDHKDRDQLNNKFKNLRPATASVNMRNRVSTRGVSGVKGVTVERGKYRARIKDGKNQRICLGRYTSKAAQAAQYDRKAKQFGDRVELRNLPCLLLDFGEICESPVFLL